MCCHGETRWIATGALLDSRIHALVFVENANGIRVISLRKANKREIERPQALMLGQD